MRAFPLLRLSASRFTVRHAHGPESGRRAKYASHTLERCENKAGRIVHHPASVLSLKSDDKIGRHWPECHQRSLSTRKASVVRWYE